MKYPIIKKFISSYCFPLFSLGIFAFFMLFFVSLVHASVIPTLSISANGDGDSVQLNIAGDPNTSVLLHYMKSGSGQQITALGNTNSNGTLATTVSSSGYGIASNSLVYVTLGGINSTQSSNISWPAVSSLISSSNMLSLSQTGLVLPIGQSATITVSNVGSSSPYLSSNSNGAIANINLSGNQITILANSYGSTVATICLTNNSSNCGSIYITVQNSNAQPLTFSQNSVSISPGQNISIQIAGGSGSYLVFNNSSQNQGVVQTNISGSAISLTTSSTTGSASITVCSTNMSSCGIINVAIGTTSSSAVTFSQSNPTVTIGQSLNVSIYGPSGSLFYVSSNSNPNIVQANLSGTTLTLLGITNGSSVVNVCASINNCGLLTVTINYDSSNNSGVRLTLSQDNVSLSIGQTVNITISGGFTPYYILSTANNIFQPILNSNILSLYGIGSGSSSMNVCSSNHNCASLSITVNGSSSVSGLPTGCSSAIGFSSTTGMPCTGSTITIIPVGCTATTMFSPITGQICTASTGATNNLPQAVSPTTLPVLCPNGMTFTSNCSVLPITSLAVNAAAVVSATIPSISKPIPVKSVIPIFKFTKAIKLNSTGIEVSELQKKLSTLGFYKGKIDGKFGSAVENAVKAFQKKYGLPQVGNVGPSTRTLLNK